MHPYFAEWYRTVSIAPVQDQLEKRWLAIEQIASSFDPKAMLEVVRLTQPDLISHSRTDDFIAAFQSVDPVFPRRDNQVEIEVLAASVMIHALSQGSSIKSDVIALAAACASFAEKRTKTLIPEVLISAQSYLKNEGLSVRTFSDAEQQKHQPFYSVPPKKLKEATDKLTEDGVDGPNIAALNNVLVADMNDLKGSLNKTLTDILENQKRIIANQGVLNEETEISWWILGEWSRDLDQPFQSLSLPMASIVAAKELADITYFLPQVSSAKHLLDKILKMRRDKKLSEISLYQAVNEVPREWREKLITKYPPSLAGDISPVLMALEKSLHTDGKDDWVPAFKKAANLDPSLSIDPLSLAIQTHMECLLTRALS